jgi:hypothetical protein
MCISPCSISSTFLITVFDCPIRGGAGELVDHMEGDRGRGAVARVRGEEQMEKSGQGTLGRRWLFEVVKVRYRDRTNGVRVFLPINAG